MSVLLTGVSAAELHRWVAHVRDSFAVVLVAQVHAVGVSVAAPAHGNAEAVHPALELVHMAAARGPRGCTARQQEARLLSLRWFGISIAEAQNSTRTLQRGSINTRDVTGKE